jgi:hypothetical protein
VEVCGVNKRFGEGGIMDGEIYHEKLSSVKTEGLFIALTVVFSILFVWRWLSIGWNGWTITILCLAAFFLFYVFNYRTLKIFLTPETLRLTFGIFTWTIAIANIQRCYLDKPSIGSIGGAGIHFTWIRGKYRAFFNFLEFPRVVIVLKKKQGPVQEITFTTKHPEQVMQIIQSGLN